MAKNRVKEKVEILSAYKNIFTSLDGEKVLKDLMENHWILKSSYSGNTNDMILREGEKNVVLRILHILDIDINALYERIDRDSEVMR